MKNIAALFVILPLAACAGGGSSSLPTSLPQSPAATQSVMEQPPLGTTQLLFVGDYENSKIFVYNAQTGKELRTITSGINGPDGMTTDKAGNLWVTNYNANTVTVYGPGKSTPKRTISNGLNGPFDVKVDGFGNVYVANDPTSGGSYVLQYAKGASLPEYQWSPPQSNTTMTGLTVLNSTTSPSLYVAGYSLNQQFQASGFVLTCFPGQSTCNQVASGFGQTGGIAVENSPGGSGPFEYLLADQYVPGVDIMQNASLTGQIFTGGTPEFIALNSTRTDLFVADNRSLDVAEYSFPGGQLVKTFTPNSSGQIFGVATYPAGTYF